MSELEPLLDHLPGYSSPVEALKRVLEHPAQWGGATSEGRLEEVLQQLLTKLCARYANSMGMRTAWVCEQHGYVNSMGVLASWLASIALFISLSSHEQSDFLAF